MATFTLTEGDDVFQVPDDAGHTVSALGGNDTISGAAGTDSIFGEDGNDQLDGGGGDDFLEGGDGNDQIFGANGNDTLIGYIGDDTLNGGDGDDAIEDEWGNNQLIGGLGNDTLYGGVGNDTIVAGAGNDTITTVSAGRSIVYAGDGNDTIYVGPNRGFDTIYGGAGDDTFIWQYGGTSATTIRGDAGWDVLYAPTQLDSMNVRGVEELRTDGTTVFVGLDQLRGFKSVTVENTGDWLSFIVAGSGGSLDLAPRVGEVGGVTVLADFATSAVALAGTDLTDAFIGTGFDDLLIGRGGDDALVGDAQRSSGGPTPTVSNDTLFGGHGNDELWGEGGDDKLYGGTGLDTLWGGDGNDLLNGGAGVDSMTGGDGDDTYIVDDTQDVTIEAAGAGVDTVRSSVAWTLGADIEHLVLTGWRSTAGTGNAADNAITGNGGRNTLAGKEGNDTINGGRGSDNLWGGSGQDTFVFDTALGANNVDRIRDFEFTGDIIALDSRIFTELTPGGIDFPVFNFGGAETLTAEQRISYDQFSGGLYYDADGAGGAAAVQFAQLQAGLALSPENFVVI